MIFKSSSGFVTWMPPSMVTPRAKKASGSMLAVGQVRSLSEAAKAAGISRSALYKYKDCVFVHNEALDDKVITLSARLEDRPGVLSGLLNSLSEQQGNILTVNQNIPVDGVAAVSVSARLPLPMAIETLRQNLLSLPV